MQEIEKLRSEIDQIHAEMASLFRRRLALAKRIWEIKKNNQMSFLDTKREIEIIHRFDGASEQPAERVALQNFFRFILSETKQYIGNFLK